MLIRFHLFESPCGTHRLQEYFTTYLDVYFVRVSIQLGCLTWKSPTLRPLTVSLCSPLRLTASRELTLWMSKWVLQPCSAIPSFSFMDLQDFLELLREFWWRCETRSCPGWSSLYCNSMCRTGPCTKNGQGCTCGNVLSHWPPLHPVTRWSRWSPGK